MQRTHALENSRRNIESNPTDESLVSRALAAPRTESSAGDHKKNGSHVSSKTASQSQTPGSAQAAPQSASESKSESSSAPSSKPQKARNGTPKSSQKRGQANSPAPSANAASHPESRLATKAPANASKRPALPANALRPNKALHPRAAAHRKLNLEAMNAALLADLLESIEEGVAHVSTDGLILYANPRFAQLIGGELLRIEANKTHLKNLMSAQCWSDLDQALKLAAKQPVSGQMSVEDAERTIARTVRLVLIPVFWKSKVTIKVTATEMTELLEKNTELQRKEDELHALSARIMQLQDDERRRIARDLHDITGQELAVVIMLLMQAAREQRADTESLKTITDAAGMVRKIEDEIRTLSYVLHPPLLDELGLGAALNWYVEGFTKRSGIEVKIEVQQGLPRLPKEKELTLFRVVQEALTNVMRHSGSRTAQLHVTCDAESVVLSIRDEGKGIKDKRFAKSTPREHGVGIPGMRERIQQFGGTIAVRPLEKGVKGTEVVAVMPIGYAAPIEMPFSENDILDMARALGYKGLATEPPAATSAPPEAATAAPAPPVASVAATPPPEAARQIAARQAAPVQPPPNSAVSFTKKRILIADDHEVTRQGIRGLLQREGDLEVCGEAQDAVDAVTKARALNPDLVVMDLSMPGGGFSAANRIRQLGLPTKVLFFTTHRAQEIERMARLAGFDGFVQKTEAARDLSRGIRAVLDGQRFYGGQIIPAEDENSKRRRAQIIGATPPRGRAQNPRHK